MDLLFAFFVLVILILCAKSRNGCFLVILIVIVILWLGKCESEREEQERKEFNIKRQLEMSYRNDSIDVESDVNKQMIEHLLRTDKEFAKKYYQVHKKKE